MAVPDPRTDLFTSRGFAQQAFDLLQRQEIARTAGGVMQGKDLGPALWTAEWATSAQVFDDVVEYEAMLRSLDGVIGTFTAYDLRRPYPKNYPDGSFTDSGKINAVASTKALSLKELPAGFVLSVGDYLAFDYGSSPTNRALHQVMEGVTANGSGLTGTFEVRPHLRDGVAADIVVTLKKPSAVFRLLPQGVASDMQQSFFGAVTFKAIQAIS